MLALACLALLPSLQDDLEDLARTLRRAVDRASYEDGAWEAARRLAEIAGPEAMALRLELFDQKLDTYRGTFLRDWFYSGMRQAASPEETGLLARAAADGKRSDLQRLLCLRALAACKADVEESLLLSRAFQRASREVQRQWQRTLGNLLAEHRLLAEDQRAGDQKERVRRVLVEAGPPFSGLGATRELTFQDCATILEFVVKGRDPFDRAEALRYLVSLAPERLYLPALEAALASGNCALRAAAVESARRRRSAPAVPLLVAALEAEAAGEQGRFLAEFGDALMDLTGQKLGYGPELWRRWWEEQGEAFLERGAAPADPGPGFGESATVARMFGLPVDSKRVAVVVDGSGSMVMDRLGERTCAEAAREELARFLEQLHEGALFNVVVVSTEPRPAFKKLTKVAPRSRQQAVDFLGAYDFGGTSSLYDVLAWTMRQKEVDTIVLISDGGSSSGSHQYAGHMLEGLTWERARTGVKVHCVCVGVDEPKIRFMGDLARATGGRMVQPSG